MTADFGCSRRNEQAIGTLCARRCCVACGRGDGPGTRILGVDRRTVLARILRLLAPAAGYHVVVDPEAPLNAVLRAIR